MNEKQRALLSDKLADLANYTVTALVLGQVIVRPGWQFAVATLGVLSAVLLYGASLLYRRS